MRSWTTLLCLALPAVAWAIQLSPGIQAVRYLVRAERKIEEQDFTGANESLDRVLESHEQDDIEVSSEFSVIYARVSLGLGLHAEAIKAATRYLTLEGREGEHFRTALELLDRPEKEMATAEAETRRTEPRSRAVWEAHDGIEFVGIPAGEFRMGSDSEGPVMQVRISQGFWLGKHEVTQAERETFMGLHPSNFDGGHSVFLIRSSNLSCVPSAAGTTLVPEHWVCSNPRGDEDWEVNCARLHSIRSIDRSPPRCSRRGVPPSSNSTSPWRVSMDGLPAAAPIRSPFVRQPMSRRFEVSSTDPSTNPWSLAERMTSNRGSHALAS